MKAKGKKWRQRVVDWGDRRSYIWNEGVRKSYYNKKINYDLWNGTVHIEDMKHYFNPYNHKDPYIPVKIQHYPIINDLLGVLIGEEYNKKFDFFVRVSNMDAISEKEKELKGIISQRIQNLLLEGLDPEQQEAKMRELSDYVRYEYQDLREMRANWILNHYIKELNFKLKTNQGFKDALISSEEIYLFDVVGGEPIMEKLNPNKVHCLRSGNSSRIEDADIVIIEDYWSPGRIIDTYYDSLEEKHVKYIDNYFSLSSTDGMKNIDETDGWVYNQFVDDIEDQFGLGNGYSDDSGNIRVLRVFWKSKRKVQKIKSYDVVTGDVVYDYKDENYIPNKQLGEESEIQWINEAWEGTKIGENIYINMRPRKIQYNRLSNPSKCHFGIIGQIYNTNQGVGVSIVDKMKPTAYLYDIVYHKLTEFISKDVGNAFEFDLAKSPEKWPMDKLLYFLKKDSMLVVDSFKEGNKGQSTGKLAGSFNTTVRPMNLSQAESISRYADLLIYLKSSLQDLSGISDQRKGSINSSETVGGVERSVVQSSHITQELFAIHDNVKKRLIECLLETAKFALKGNRKKYQFIGDDYSSQLFDLDGDEFAESDYGIIVDQDGNNSQIEQKIEQLAHAWSQNDTINPSTILKIIKGTSLSKALRDVETDQQEKSQQRQQELQAQQEQVQAQIQAEVDKFMKEQELKKYEIDANNDTKLAIAGINALPDDEQDNSLEFEKFNHAKEIDNNKLDLDERKLSETIRTNKAKENIAKSKPKSTK